MQQKGRQMQEDVRHRLRARAETRTSHFVLLRAALSHATRIESRHLRNVELTPVERSLLEVLRELEPHHPSPTQLQDVFAVDRKSLLRTVRALDDRKLVRLVRQMGKRDSQVSLLPAGRALLALSGEAYAAAQKEIKAWLNAAGVQDIHLPLQRLTGLAPVIKRVR